MSSYSSFFFKKISETKMTAEDLLIVMPMFYQALDTKTT